MHLVDARKEHVSGAHGGQFWPSPIHLVVAQCGGFTSSTRAPGGEATVSVFLPCSAVLKINEAGGVYVSPEEPAAGESILLVDDEPLIRELSRDMLERQGYRVILASDATEAERISDNGVAFDLLITDLAMANISGAELARRLRLRNPELKVLFISGYSDYLDENDLNSFDAAFLQKPFSADSLGRKIRQVLDRS